MRRAAADGLSLERKLPLLISALVLAVVMLYSWAAYREVRASAMLSVNERVKRVARQLADISAQTAARRNEMTSALGRSAEILAVLRGGGSDVLAAERLRSSATPLDSTLTTWVLASATGEQQLLIGTTPPAREMEMVDSLTSEAARTHAPQAGPFVSAGDSVWTWSVVPVGSAERLEGFVAQRRRLQNAPQVAEQIRELTGRDISVRFANVKGDIWTDLYGGPEPGLFSGNIPDSTFETVTPAGERVIGAVARVPGSPYLIVLSVPRSVVLQRAETFLRRMLLTGLALLVLGTIGAWLLSRHVTRPLREVSDAADAVASGNYAQRVVVERDDELGRLGDAFNIMAERIGAARNELEQRVDDSVAMSDALTELNTELRTAQHEAVRAADAERAARSDAEEVARRSAALSSASAALVGSLDVDTTLSLIVDLATEELAEYAQIFLVEGREIRRSALACTVPEKLPLLEELGRGVPHRLEGTSPHAEVIRTRRPLLAAVVEDQLFVRAATDPAHLDLLRRIAWRSLIFAPLEARGNMIGVLACGHFRSDKPFDADDVDFAVELARRAALAVDNARLYQGEQQARTAAEHASRVKSDFLAVMSHELRTPLNAIIGYTSLIADEIVGPVSPAQQTQLGRVKTGARHLLSLIEQILSLSRLEAGKEEVIVEHVDIREIARETAALVEPAAMSKQLRFEVKMPLRPVEIDSDPTKVRQIMLNLLGNAVKFTESGFVELALEEDGAGVTIRVRDSGEGIAPEHAERIFEPFWQVGQTRYARAAGTGLGLSVSRQLARLLGGDITVESELGRGSTFTVRLPRASSGLPSAGAVPLDASAAPADPRSTR